MVVMVVMLMMMRVVIVGDDDGGGGGVDGGDDDATIGNGLVGCVLVLQSWAVDVLSSIIPLSL